MKKVVVISMAIIFLSGCVSPIINRKNLLKLDVGMSKSEVIEIMGKPYRREAIENTEWLLYKTESRHAMMVDERAYLTPLFLQDGTLVGWGNTYWNIIEQKYDIKIDQTIEQK